MTYQPRQPKPKALYVQAGLGGYKPREPKQKKPVRKRSPRQTKREAAYNRRVRAWKKGRKCIGSSIKAEFIGLDGLNFPCLFRAHACQDCHHSRGKLGPLLMDERFWVPTCRSLHSWIQDNPAEARTLGLLCEKGLWNKPAN